MDNQQLIDLTHQVRRDIVRMVHGVQSGHPGAALGCTELLVLLYNRFLRYNPSDWRPDGEGEDVFLLSNGHLSALWYSVLARAGYFPLQELSTFRQIDSRLQGHPTAYLPGIRVASGSLGQGLSVGLGFAQAKKLNRDNGLVYCLCGDGELQEGQVWEALMYASAKEVDSLIAIVDVNGQQIDGPTEQVLSLGGLRAKFEAFGWRVWSCNGNDLLALDQTLKAIQLQTRRGFPCALLLHTQMGYGVDFMVGTHHWHGKAPNDEQLQRALAQLPETLGDY